MSSQQELRFSSQEEALQYLTKLRSEQNYNHFAGIDEVGRGPGAGPVVAACVVLEPNHGIEGIRDSKKLSAKRREFLAGQIKEKSKWSLGIRTNHDIDHLNIRVATFQAAAEAALTCMYKGAPIDFLLCDGGLFLEPLVPFPTVSVVKGDLWFECISAASIVAKVHRDNLMKQFHQRWPEYGFDTNSGYLTKIHRQAILDYGMTPIHRKSFGICKTAKEREDVSKSENT